MGISLHHKTAWLILLAIVSHRAQGDSVDLLAKDGAAWQEPAEREWIFEDSLLVGSTPVFDGDKTDPNASAFLVSSDSFSGDKSVSIDLSFTRGRYLGVYLDFSQETQSGIWMATGHALDAGAPSNEIERAYIKTVDNGEWVVRATGDLPIEQGARIRLRFVRHGDVYSIWRGDRLIATFQYDGGYPGGPLQLRLTNTSAKIYRMEIQAASVE